MNDTLNPACYTLSKIASLKIYINYTNICITFLFFFDFDEVCRVHDLIKACIEIHSPPLIRKMYLRRAMSSRYRLVRVTDRSSQQKNQDF